MHPLTQSFTMMAGAIGLLLFSLFQLSHLIPEPGLTMLQLLLAIITAVTTVLFISDLRLYQVTRPNPQEEAAEKSA